jgi:hypothetical protein
MDTYGTMMRAYKSSRMGYEYFPGSHWTTEKSLQCRAAMHLRLCVFLCLLCGYAPVHSSTRSCCDMHAKMLPVSQCFMVKSCTASSTCWLGPTRHRRLGWRRRLDGKSGEPFLSLYMPETRTEGRSNGVHLYYTNAFANDPAFLFRGVRRFCSYEGI